MSHSERRFENPGKPLRAVNAREELVKQLNRILLLAPPTVDIASASKAHGLYSGISSTAFLFYRLSELYPALKVQGQSLREIASAYHEAGSSLSAAADTPDPAHCGIANESLVSLTLNAVLGDEKTAIKSATKLASSVTLVLQTNDPNASSNEWLYGRAGYLYLLRTVRDHLRKIDADVTDRLERTMHQVADAVLGTQYPWTWHGKAYLGAAHGIIGIITQLVLSTTSPTTSPPSTILKTHLAELLRLQFPSSGNFPSSLPPHGDKLVQFCHGAPGFVASLSSLRPYFPTLHAEIDDALRRARSCVWQRGLLTKPACLCHGIAGNAIVLGGDSVADKRHRIETFLTYPTTSETAPGEGVLGLYTGEAAGMAWAWAVADRGLYDRIIGYNDV